MSVASVFDDIGRTLGNLAYVVSPILLEGGVAEKTGLPVPILVYTEAVALVNGLISGGIKGQFNMPDLDNMWCHWKMASSTDGSLNTILDYDIALHTLGTQNSACCHFIRNPLTVSMQMMCYARGPGAMVTKLATIQSLQAILDKHMMMGGRFIIITPGFYYTDMVLAHFTDITKDHAIHPASVFQLDFQQAILPKSAQKKKKEKATKKAFSGELIDLNLKTKMNFLNSLTGSSGIELA
ncbi:hypothetical protein PT277_08010 [Acetobacteraceae bacterium ESL0709]|nr:hypothetical protein [Acetobacteraceae bacterium ESL0697]MDF7678624.1 hypothetical protein [Acetobacteraceae bacterium ESL0709]